MAAAMEMKSGGGFEGLGTQVRQLGHGNDYGLASKLDEEAAWLEARAACSWVWGKRRGSANSYGVVDLGRT